jgi:hypothetical protein
MCFVRISEQTATFALKNIQRLFFITEVESVYSAVRTESLYKTDTLRLSRVNQDGKTVWKIYHKCGIRCWFMKIQEVSPVCRRKYRLLYCI